MSWPFKGAFSLVLIILHQVLLGGRSDPVIVLLNWVAIFGNLWRTLRTADNRYFLCLPRQTSVFGSWNLHIWFLKTWRGDPVLKFNDQFKEFERWRTGGKLVPKVLPSLRSRDLCLESSIGWNNGRTNITFSYLIRTEAIEFVHM